MMETDTVWDDSGFDCNHCGGEIYKRTEREEEQPVWSCYECQLCGCQWSLEGQRIQVGYDHRCQPVESELENPIDKRTQWMRRAFIIAGILLLSVALRYATLVTLRIIIPLALIAVVVFLTVRYVRKQQQKW